MFVIIFNLLLVQQSYGFTSKVDDCSDGNGFVDISWDILKANKNLTELNIDKCMDLDEILILSGKFTGLDSFRRDDYVCYRKRPEGKRFSLEGPFILSDVNFDVKIRAKMDLKVTKIPVDADVTGNLTYLRTYMSVDVDTDNQTINFSKWIVQRQTGYNLDINYKHSWGLINYIANSLIKINLVEGWVNELVQKLIVREYFAKMFKVEKAVSRESECDSVPNVLPEIPTDEKEKIKSKWASLV